MVNKIVNKIELDRRKMGGFIAWGSALFLFL